MRTQVVFVLATLLLPAILSAAAIDNVYKLGPDSEEQPGVPHGKVAGPTTLPSNVFPGTTRNYWVYVPAQYDASKPASLMIFQDGHAFLGLKGEYRIPNVFDNLIYRREMPVTQKHYDVNYTWGIGTHSNKQGGAIMPEMLRWLWRDYPRPDDPKEDSNRKLFIST